MSFLRKIANRGKGGNDANLPRSKTFPTDQNDNSRPASIQQFLNEKEKTALTLGQSKNSTSTDVNYPERSSRLSQTLKECLSDPSSVGYLLQYLETRKLNHLVKFYLDVESYRCSATTETSSVSGRSLTPAPEEHPLPPQAPVVGYSSVSPLKSNNLSATTSDAELNVANNNNVIPEVNCDKSPPPPSLLAAAAGEVHQEERSYTDTTGSHKRIDAALQSPTMSLSSSTATSLSKSATSSSNLESGGVAVASESSDSFDSGFVKSDADSIKDGVSVDYNTDSDSMHSFHLHQGDQNSIVEENFGQRGHTLKANTEDAVKIYRRYIAPDSETPVSIPTDMKKEIVEQICAQFGLVSATCFDDAQAEVCRQLEEGHYPEYLTSAYHTKHQIDVLTGGSVGMTDILHEDLALFNFMEFMEGEGVRHILEFWIAANNFEISINSCSDSPSYSDVTHDAMILYDKYFSMQAKYPLGFGDDIRLEIENNICQDSGPQTNCFHRPLGLTVEYMEKKYLDRFLSSKLFDNFVKELISSVQNGPGLHLERYRSTESLHSCTSDQGLRASSLSVQNRNTLLANADQLSTRLENIQIDTTSLTDPDSIWKRDPVKGRIGEVDSLGRYHSYWEPAPDINKEGGILGKVKRLGGAGRGGQQARLKEEMAWQVASMFIQDVVSVTMDKDNIPDSDAEDNL